MATFCVPICFKFFRGQGTDFYSPPSQAPGVGRFDPVDAAQLWPNRAPYGGDGDPVRYADACYEREP